MSRSTFLITLGAALLLSSGSAMAAGVDLAQSNSSMTGLLRLIHDASDQWAPRLHGYALWLLGCLATIQLVWTFTPMVLRGADLGEILHDLIKFIMVIGFFYALLDYATEWGSAIVNSFRQAGAHAAGLGGAELMPGDMFATAVEFSRKVLTAGVSVFSPITSFVVAISALIVLICFTFIAALVFGTLVEAYVIINAAVLFMGFGGSQWTREYAMAPVRYAVAVGAKLFVLTLIVGLIMQVTADWSAAFTNDEASLMTLVGLSLLCAYLTKSIPELISGMISGTSMGGGSAIGGMVAAGAAGAATAIAAIATAGAASPVAGAIQGASSGAGASSGGLATALNSSIAGGHGVGTTNAAASISTSTSTGTGVSSGGSSAAKSAGSRVGGSAPVTTNASPTGAQQLSGGTDAAKQAGKAASQLSAKEKKQGQATPKEEAPKRPNEFAQAAEGIIQTFGMLSALAVPGMEGSQNLSLSPQSSTLGSSGTTPENNSQELLGSDTNIIRPTPGATSSQSLESLSVPGMSSNRTTQSENQP